MNLEFQVAKAAFDFWLDNCRIPKKEYYRLAKLLFQIPELKNVTPKEISVRDKRDGVMERYEGQIIGNVQFRADYDSSLGDIETMQKFLQERTGLQFSHPRKFYGGETGSVIYKFRDGENYARVILTPVPTDSQIRE